MGTIIKDETESVLSDFSELCLDAFLNDGLLKEFPIVSSVVSVYKIGHSVKELSYIRKLIKFLDGLNKGNIDEKAKQLYIGRITKNKRTFQHELEYVLMLIDRIISDQKIQYLSKAYVSHINGEIDWTLFCQYSEIIDRFLPGDAEYMRDNFLHEPNHGDMEKSAILRLQGLGLVSPISKPGAYDIDGNVIVTKKDDTFELTAFGVTLAKILLT